MHKNTCDGILFALHICNLRLFKSNHYVLNMVVARRKKAFDNPLWLIVGFGKMMTPDIFDTHTNPVRSCHMAGCKHPGIYPAPHSPDRPQPYIWLCLQHVREHNAKWNYFHNYSAQEIEKEIRKATVWERPTWPFGKGPLSHKHCKKTTKRKGDYLPPEVKDALHLLELAPTCTLHAVKVRYRELVKKYHPDIHKNEETKTEKFLAIQQAFGTLKKYYAKKQSQTSDQSKK